MKLGSWEGDRKRAVAALAPRARPIEARNRFDGLQSTDDDDDDEVVPRYSPEGGYVATKPIPILKHSAAVELPESMPGPKRPRKKVQFLRTSNCACQSDNSCGHSYFPNSAHFEHSHSLFLSIYIYIYIYSSTS